MRGLLATLIILLIPEFSARNSDAQSLNTNQLNAVGQIEVWILDPDGDLVESEPERGTGAIVSPDGHVLTAGHLFTDETYAICTAAASADSGETCEIYFYQKGFSSRKFNVSIETELSDTLDYVVLRLPAVEDALDGPSEWPHLFFGTSPNNQERLTGAGYDGTKKPNSGPNKVRTIEGNYSPIDAPACTEGDGWGYSKTLLAQSEPGFSGGPVFDGNGRLTGIILGRGCNPALQSKPTTRVLPIERIPNLCDLVGCRYGLPGFIAARDPELLTPWQERLEGGAGSATKIIYGIELETISKFYHPIWIACTALGADAQVLDLVRKDANRGGELANVLLANWIKCNPNYNIPSTEFQSNRERVFDLADEGYEPAQMMAVSFLTSDLIAKISVSENMDYQFNEREQRDLELAYKYLTAATDSGWAAAAYMKFEFCRFRLGNCTPKLEDLKSAADFGQPDARRMLALLQLLGDDAAGSVRAKYGISVPQNKAEALKTLRLNATMQGPMSGRWPHLDGFSSFILQYLYGGGRHRGAKLVTADLQQANFYQQGCNAWTVPFSEQHRACYFFGQISNFNLTNAAIRKQIALNFQVDAANVDRIGSYSGNISSWLTRDPTIDKIECELAEDFSFQTNPIEVPFAPKSAYCYWPPPEKPDPCSLSGLVGDWKCVAGKCTTPGDISTLYQEGDVFWWRDGEGVVNAIEFTPGTLAIYNPKKNTGRRYVGKLNQTCDSIDWKNGSTVSDRVVR